MHAYEECKDQSHWNPGYLTLPLHELDPEISGLLNREVSRQHRAVHLLAPSMLISRSVRECLASVLGNLDGEGYVGRSPGLGDFKDFAAEYRRRGPLKYNPSGPAAEYIEHLAMHRVATMLAHGTSVDAGDIWVNLQPASGSIANVAILRGLAAPGSTILALDTASGGHISHGAPFHYTGQMYRTAWVAMGVQSTALDLDELRRAVAMVRPQVVMLGASSFPRRIDWAGVRGVLDEVAAGARPILVADIAHFAGLVAAGCYPNPLPWADVVSFVGYKTLGGPKSAVIVTRDPATARKIDRALFPGLQGAPRVAEIAAMAVAAGFAATPQFRTLIERSLEVAQVFARVLRGECGQRLAFGGSDTHMLMIDHSKPVNRLVQLLEQVGILVNANLLPGDAAPAASRGIRMGTVAVVQRGLSPATAKDLARLVGAVITKLGSRPDGDPATAGSVHRFRDELRAWTGANLSELM
jgi:glycine hydroxymethyltransferase